MLLGHVEKIGRTLFWWKKSPLAAGVIEFGSSLK